MQEQAERDSGRSCRATTGTPLVPVSHLQDTTQLNPNQWLINPPDTAAKWEQQWKQKPVRVKTNKINVISKGKRKIPGRRGCPLENGEGLMCSSSRMAEWEKRTQGRPKWSMAFSPHASARRMNNEPLSNHQEQRDQSRTFQRVWGFSRKARPGRNQLRGCGGLAESLRNPQGIPFPHLEKGKAGTGAAVTSLKKTKLREWGMSKEKKTAQTWIPGNF